MIFLGLLLRGLLRLTARLLLLILVVATLAKLVTFAFSLYAERHHQEIEQIASRLLGIRVQVERIETSWRGFTPRLWLRKLVLGDEERLQLGDVLVATNLGALPWWRENLPISVLLRGTRITVVRDAEGHTRILGMLRSTGRFNLPALILVEDATIEWRDHRRKVHLEEPHLDLQLQSRGSGARLGVRARQRNLHLRADIQGRLTSSSWSARIWAEGENLEGGDLLKHYLPDGYRLDDIQLDFEGWSHWTAGRHSWSRIRFDLKNARLQPAQRGPLELERMSGDLLYEIGETGWSLQLADLDLDLVNAPPLPETRMALLSTGDRRLLGIERLELQALSPLVDFLPMTDRQRQALTAMEPRGRLSGIRLVSEGKSGGWFARARVTELATNRWERIPGVKGFSAELFADTHSARLTLACRDAELDMRPLFRTPIALDQVEGRIEWRRSGEQGWVIESRDLEASNSDIKTYSRLELTHQPGKPLFMDMQTDFRDGDGRQAGTYYPVGIMKEKLVQWLDEAIVLGRIPKGSFLLYGPLSRKSFPYHKTHEGHFEVLFEAADLELKYHSQWPPLEDTRAEIRFHNNSLSIEADQSRIYGSRIDRVVARIPSLKPLAPLEVTGFVQGPLADHLKILRETPLKATLARAVEGLDVKGEGLLQATLKIPFKGRDYRFNGLLGFRNAALTLTRHQLTLSQLEGTLEIDNQGIRGSQILGKALGAEVAFDIEPMDGFTRVTAQGRVPASGLLQQHAEFGLLKLSGSAEARLELDLPSQKDQQGRSTVLRVSSDLDGMAFELPPPLAKRAGKRRRLDAALELSGKERRFTLKLDNDLGLTLHTDAAGDSHLNVRFSRFPLRHWVRWYGDLPEQEHAALNLKKILFRTGQLEAMPLSASDFELDLERKPDSWRGSLRSEAIAGRLHMDLRPGTNRLSLQLDHLHLVMPKANDDNEAAPTPTETVVVDPRQMASLQIRSKKFRFNQAELGTLTVNTTHVPEGQVIETIEFQGGIAELQARGAWLADGEQGLTRLAGSLTSPDTGRFLKQALELDFLAGSKGYFSFDLSWPGAPYQFDLTEVEGRLQLDMTAGRFLNIKPGAARILGLLNVRAIGRRLQFGFKDVYEKGLAFDTIMGSFQLDNGLIYTNDLEISAPSSLIRVAGSTNLVKQTHDQLVTVSPRLDATLPLAGLLAGGPTTGLAVLLAQQALADKFTEAQRLYYTVTGSWDEPRVAPLKSPESAPETVDLLDQ